MNDKPIIFSGPMIRALLDGRKTQTRRLLTPDPDSLPNGFAGVKLRYTPGDRLYVREAFNAFQFSQDGDDAWPVKVPTLEECKEADELAYRYGAPQIVYRESDRVRKWFADQKWRPSIHMPRWASRLTMTVTDVRVQRLQEISEADAMAEGAIPIMTNEGVSPSGMPFSEWSWRDGFRVLWNSLHGPDAWDANPWVVAIIFTVQHGNIDHLALAEHERAVKAKGE